MKHWLISRPLFSPLHRFVANKNDRALVFSASSTPFSFLMALSKLIIGGLYMSLWMVGFGIYYLVLVFSKTWLYYRYTLIRVGKTTTSEKRLGVYHEIVIGGLLLSLVGLSFAGFSGLMLFHGYQERFSNNLTYMIAFMGFIKMGTSATSLVRARKLHNPLIQLIKAFNVANATVAIVLTQFAILSMEHSPVANFSTGLFGLVIGGLIAIGGLWITFKYERRAVKVTH